MPGICIDQLSDKEIVNGLLARDKAITMSFLYEKCYPLFKALYTKFDTDCSDCIEFINEIYVYIMTKSKKTHMSKLEMFGFRCHLVHWVRIVSVNYCISLYKKKQRLPQTGDNDGLETISGSMTLDTSIIDHEDLEKVLAMMPNPRYRQIIRYHYIECRSNEETASLMKMSTDNFYNRKRLAKRQFINKLKEEGLI